MTSPGNKMVKQRPSSQLTQLTLYAKVQVIEHTPPVAPEARVLTLGSSFPLMAPPLTPGSAPSPVIPLSSSSGSSPSSSSSYRATKDAFPSFESCPLQQDVPTCPQAPPFLPRLLPLRAPPFQGLLPLPHPLRAAPRRVLPSLILAQARATSSSDVPASESSFLSHWAGPLALPPVLWSGALPRRPGSGRGRSHPPCGASGVEGPGQLSPRRRSRATVAPGYGRAGGGPVRGRCAAEAT